MYIAGVNRAVDIGDTYFNEIGTNLGQQILKVREIIKRMPISDSTPLRAKINYGRWVVDCPNCDNVEFAFEDGLFFCTSCQNGDKKPRRVLIHQDRKKIEKILSKRMIKNRHWDSSESIEDLEKENKAHKVEEA